MPCFEPDGWNVELARFVHRPESEASDFLLLTVQSLDDARTDAEDEQRHYNPHRAVYRFDPTTEVVELVEDAVWDGATGAVAECCTRLRPEPPFELVDNRLYLGSALVPVTGGNAIVVSQSPSGRAIAVLSTNGSVSFFFPIASGQHFHQVFSRADGSPVGQALRLAVGGRENSGVAFDWTLDERYVIYQQSLQTSGNLGIGRVCIVPVGEALESLDE